MKSEGMLSGIRGLEDDEHEARGLLGHGLAARGEDALLVKAVLQPNAAPPKATLQDARNIYLKERIKDDQGAATRLERTCSRVVNWRGC